VYFLSGISADALSELYFFVPNPGVIDTQFLGLIDLTGPSPILAILAGFFMFLQSKITFSQRPKTKSEKSDNNGKPDFQSMMGKQMTYVMPFFIIVISWNFPAGLPLYWATTTLFSFFPTV